MDEENLQQLGTDLLKYRVSPWWRLSVREDFPPIFTLAADAYPPGIGSAKINKTYAKRIVDYLKPAAVDRLVKIIREEVNKLAEAEMNQPIQIVYPRRPKDEQNLFAIAFVEQVTKILSEALPYKFEICHELFNLTPSSRTVGGGAKFDIRSRVASPTLFGKGDKRKLFLFADDVIATGNIAAEVSSFIAHYGGHLLAATGFFAKYPSLQSLSHDIELFEQKYPKNSDDYKALERVLHLMGLTIETLSEGEMFSLSKPKPFQCVELYDLQYQLHRAKPVPELTEAHKIFFDRIKEAAKGQERK